MKTFPARIHRLYPSVSLCHHTPSQGTGQLLPGCFRGFSSAVADLAWLTHSCSTLSMDCRRSLLSVQRLLTAGGAWMGSSVPAPSRAPCRNCTAGAEQETDETIPDYSGHQTTQCLYKWQSFYPLCTYHGGAPEASIL